jgi:hypothetical protein
METDFLTYMCNDCVCEGVMCGEGVMCDIVNYFTLVSNGKSWSG